MIGTPDAKYGEVVGAFIAINSEFGGRRPSDEELQNWIRQTLGRHKAPRHIFVFGTEGIDREIPVTGSGKVRKEELRKMAAEIMRSRATS